MRRFLSVALATFLLLTVPAAAFAASASTPESLTVPSSLTITGLPAAINFGSVLGGATAQSTVFQITVTGNTGYTLTMNAGDWSGPSPFTASARQQFMFSPSSGNETWSVNTGQWIGAPGIGVTVATDAVAPAPDVFSMQTQVTVPSNAAPGAYSATLTLSVS